MCSRVDGVSYSPMSGVLWTPDMTSQLTTFGPCKSVNSILRTFVIYWMTRHTPPWVSPEAVAASGKTPHCIQSGCDNTPRWTSWFLSELSHPNCQAGPPKWPVQRQIPSHCGCSISWDLTHRVLSACVTVVTVLCETVKMVSEANGHFAYDASDLNQAPQKTALYLPT